MRAPFAEWRGPLPAANYAPGQMGQVIGVTVHHMDGSLASADGWFHNPSAGSSAHFGVGYDGHIVQWVDTDSVAYHACRANWTGWVGIENESDPNVPDGPPTDAQIAAMGQIISWLGVPAVPATSPTSGGVGYHRQFPGACNAAWGQTSCPGQGFVDAIPRICAAAGGGSGDIVTPEQMDTLGAWMKQQRELEEKTIGQWLKDVEGRLKAYIDAKVTAPGGVSEAQVRTVVREELNKTKLAG